MSLRLRLAIPVMLLVAFSLTAQEEDVEWIDQQPCSENEGVYSPSDEGEAEQMQPTRKCKKRRCRVRLFCRRPCPCYWKPPEASWPSKLDDSFYDDLTR